MEMPPRPRALRSLAQRLITHHPSPIPRHPRYGKIPFNRLIPNKE